MMQRQQSKIKKKNKKALQESLGLEVDNTRW